jgi:hypothetical protein
MKKIKEEAPLLRQSKILNKELKALQNDPVLCLDGPMVEVIKPFYNDMGGDPKVLRKAYIAYFRGVLDVLKRSSSYDLISLPLIAHIRYLEDLDTGNIPDYLKPKKVGRKLPKSSNAKFKEVFVAASMTFLMEQEFSKNEAAEKVAMWCEVDKIDLGGQRDTPLSIRIKRIRDEISNDIQQKVQYDRLCKDWQNFGENRAEAARAMLKIVKLFSL